jgi:Cell wall-active antibiotics response 4TMS YvqF
VTSPNHTEHVVPGALTPRPTLVPEALVPERRGVIGFLSQARREGDWILPRLFRGLALMGYVELDLTKVHAGAGTSQIEVKAIMGAVVIVVPPDLRIECNGNSIVGSFDVARHVASTTSPDAPLVRITGTAIFGSVEIKVVDSDAPGWLDRLLSRRSA